MHLRNIGIGGSDTQVMMPPESPSPVQQESHPDLDAWSAAGTDRRHRRGRRRIFGRLRLLTFTALGIVLIASSVTLARTSGPAEPITHHAKAAPTNASTPTKASKATISAPTHAVTRGSGYGRVSAAAADTVSAAQVTPRIAPTPQEAELPMTGNDAALAALRLGSILIMFGMLLHGATAPVRRQRSLAMRPR